MAFGSRDNPRGWSEWKAWTYERVREGAVVLFAFQETTVLEGRLKPTSWNKSCSKRGDEILWTLGKKSLRLMEAVRAVSLRPTVDFEKGWSGQAWQKGWNKSPCGGRNTGHA